MDHPVFIQQNWLVRSLSVQVCSQLTVRHSETALSISPLMKARKTSCAVTPSMAMELKLPYSTRPCFLQAALKTEWFGEAARMPMVFSIDGRKVSVVQEHISGDKNSTEMYRVIHLLRYLGWVYFELRCSTACPILLGLMGIW